MSIDVVNSDAPPIEALTGSLRDYSDVRGKDLLGRIEGFFRWQDLRRRSGLWPYSRSTESAPRPFCAARSDDGTEIAGVNFGSQDYLNLSSHPAVKAAAIGAIEQYGVHSAGSAALLGNTKLSLELEQVIARFLRREHAVLYPTGWSAGFAAVQGLVRPDDHVLMDVLSHSCMQEGALAATRNIHFYGHLNVEGAERRLRRIREKDTRNAILVVTESLFSMHSDTPDIRALQDLCREYEATLLVDVAHDLGCIGETGHGHLGLQGVLDDVDLIIGSFSKSFGSNGGFVATNSQAVREYLKYYSATQTFSNALSPAQAATVLKAFEIVQSDEGRALRASLMDNILYLRDQLGEARLEVTGDPSAIVPVEAGTEGLARIAAQRLSQQGVVANLVEYPAVPRGRARFRLQVMARHSRRDVDVLVSCMRRALDAAEADFRPFGGEIAAAPSVAPAQPEPLAAVVA